MLAKWKADTHCEKHWDIKAETTFEKLMVAYLSHSENKRSAKTDRYRAVNLRAYFAGQIMNRLEPSRIRAFIVARRHAGVSDSTINRDLALLSSAINDGNRELELNLPNPIKGRALEEPESRTRWITREEAERLIDAATHARKVPFLADFITLALYTGCRKEELRLHGHKR